MKTRLIFLLLSGVVLVSCSFTRHFHFVKKYLTWSEAQRHCRKHFTDLAKIQDSGQHAKAKVAALYRWVWIGLYQHWEWSVEHEGVRPLTGFENWRSTDQQNFKRVVISSDGKWTAKGSNHQNPFICYKANTDSHFLVPELLNWVDARSRCRNMSAELSRIRNQQENTMVAALLTNQSLGYSYSQAWIGLSKSPWKWSDGGRVSYMKWRENQVDVQLPRCVIMSMNGDGDWYKRRCGELRHFLCYTDVPHKDLRSVKIQLSGGSADLNDPAVQDSILQQLKQKMEERDLRGVKLRWKIQPDGKVFHKEEEERASPGGDCEDII